MIAKGIDKLFGDQRLSYRRLTCWITYIGADAATRVASAWKGNG